MGKAKYLQIAELVKRRIHNGDYAFTAIPGAPRLAEENGVSYLTARQAIQYLIEQGVLLRSSNGRLEAGVGAGPSEEKLKVVHIRPAYFDTYPVWDYALNQVAESLSCNLRTIFYRHPDDPIIFEAMDGDFDLIFLQYFRCDELFLRKVEKRRERLVTLFQDLTAYGIRLLDGLAPKEIGTLVRGLYDLGHRHIDFLNCSPDSRVIQERLAVWQHSLKELGCTGQVHHDPVKPFGSASLAAYELSKQLLSSRNYAATAIFCSTVGDAQGLLRGCHELGIDIPGRLSVCSFGSPESARLTIPSLTVVDRPDPTPEIRSVFEFYLGRGGDSSRLCYRPANSNSVVFGESTGPAPGISQSFSKIHIKEKEYVHV